MEMNRTEITFTTLQIDWNILVRKVIVITSKTETYLWHNLYNFFICFIVIMIEVLFKKAT